MNLYIILPWQPWHQAGDDGYGKYPAHCHEQNCKCPFAAKTGMLAESLDLIPGISLFRGKIINAYGITQLLRPLAGAMGNISPPPGAKHKGQWQYLACAAAWPGGFSRYYRNR